MLRTVGILDKIGEENLTCKATVEREQHHSKLYLILVNSAEWFGFRVTLFYVIFLYTKELSFRYYGSLVLLVHSPLGKLWVPLERLR